MNIAALLCQNCEPHVVRHRHLYMINSISYPIVYERPHTKKIIPAFLITGKVVMHPYFHKAEIIL